MKEDANGNKTYYVRDAGGTLLSVYTATGIQTPQQQEVMLYGSGRLGMEVPGSSIATTDVADYYPFGLRMRGNLNSYRFGYHSLSRSCIGREYAEDETEETGWNSFEARMYDLVIGRWLSVDPYRQFASPYIGMGNNPINLFDPNGGCVDGQGNVIPCPDGVEDGMNGFHTTVLDEFVFTSSVVDASTSLISSVGVGQSLNTSLTKSYEQAQMLASMETALVINMVAAFLDPSSENHGNENEIAMSLPMLGGPAKSAKVYKDFNKARNAAIKWLEQRGFKAQKPTLGKFGSIKGKPIGMQTSNSKTGFRIEHDANGYTGPY